MIKKALNKILQYRVRVKHKYSFIACSIVFAANMYILCTSDYFNTVAFSLSMIAAANMIYFISIRKIIKPNIITMIVAAGDYDGDPLDSSIIIDRLNNNNGIDE